MRKLSIYRRKQFVAAAMKVRICIKTELKGDIKLLDTNLKVLGELRNGKTLEVEIPEDNVEVYVVYDKFLPQKFHSKVSLEAGERDEVLHTYSRFNPFKGNPFAISPNKELTNADKLRMIEDESNRGKSTTTNIIYWGIMIVATIVGLVLGMSLFS